MTTDSRLRSHVLSIVDVLENPPMVDEAYGVPVGKLGWRQDDDGNWLDPDGIERDDVRQMNGWDYLIDALDIQYIVSSKLEFLGARVLVAYGGPNIWINTQTHTVEGHWWGEEFIGGYGDNIGLNDALEEHWAAVRS